MRAVASLAVSFVLATVLVIGVVPVQRAAADEGHQQIAIASYDITGTPMSGFGCWGHTYDGAITDTGRTAGGSVGCSEIGDHIANYSGGSGTLNDGVIGTSNDDTHLFLNGRLDDAGNAVNPTITLHLAEPAYVQGISLYGGDIAWNAIPGALTAMTVDIAGKTMTAATTGFGPLNGLGLPTDDYFDLAYTEESWYPTLTIVLHDFQAELFGSFDQFSLTEITVDGDPATEVAIEVKGDTSTKAGDPVIKTTRGKVPVIIYGSSTFSVRDIQADGGALFFGVYGWEVSLGWCNKPEDVNKDGYPDLTCQFISYAIDWTQGLTTVRLNGRTMSGDRFFGTDTISVKS